MKFCALFIVLTLATGLNGTLLCQAWCDPAAAAASGCHHDAESSDTSVAGVDSCLDLAAIVTAVLPEKDGRDATAAGAAHAVLNARYHAHAPQISTQAPPQMGHSRSLERRPVSTALRI